MASRGGSGVGLVAFFTTALKEFHSTHSNFRVLCSLSTDSPSQCWCEPTPPSAAPATLVVLDSSFNPPTLAHRRMALSALAEESHTEHNSRVLLLLAIKNADKAPKPSPFPQRLAMMYIFALDLIRAQAREGVASPVDIAVTAEPYFHSKSAAVASSDFYKGADRAGQSPSGAKSTTNQVYLTGFDTLIRIFDPKYYPNNTMTQSLDPLFAQSELRVTMRTDADWGDAQHQRRYLAHLRAGELEKVGGRQQWADRIVLVEGRRGDEHVISSTKVRRAVSGRQWAELKTLVSGGVADYIKSENLFKEDS